MKILILIGVGILAEIIIFCTGLIRYSMLADQREIVNLFGSGDDHIRKRMADIVLNTFLNILLCLVICFIIGILVV